MNSLRDKRTILYVSGFPDIVGGGQRSFFLLLKSLDRSRFRPVVVCPSPGEVSREVARLGCEVCFLEHPPLRISKIWNIISYTRKLRAIAAEIGADLIHCDTLDTAFLSGISFSGLPLVFHARVSDKGAILDKVVPFFCDSIVCVSTAVTKRFYGLSGRAARTHVIYNGVDPEEFNSGISGASFRNNYGIEPGGQLLGYCGQLVEEKGLRVLVNAFRIINREFPQSRLVLAGRGVLEPELRRLVHESNLDGSVFFTGFVENAPEFMAALDFFILPSHMEGFSRVLLEAMSCGKPVIATAAGGNLETVRDGLTGYLFPVGAPDELARKAMELMRDKVLAKKMGKAGRIRAVENFSARKTTEEIQALYVSILTGRDVSSATGCR